MSGTVRRTAVGVDGVDNGSARPVVSEQDLYGPSFHRERRPLRLLGHEPVRRILTALADGPLRVGELEERIHDYSEGTLRRYRNMLYEFGLVERREHGGTSRAVTEWLTESGEALLAVLAYLERWLAARPEGPVALESKEASTVLGALAEGWRMRLLPHIAYRPFALTELQRRIHGFAGSEMKRRVEKLKQVGVLEQIEGAGRERPYRSTEWGRRLAGPQLAAARWEYEHMPSISPPLGPHGTIAMLRLALDLIELPADAEGLVQLTASGDGESAAALHFEVEDGRIENARFGAPEEPTAWANATPHGWIIAILNRRAGDVQPGGDRELVATVVDRLHAELVKR